MPTILDCDIAVAEQEKGAIDGDEDANGDLQRNCVTAMQVIASRCSSFGNRGRLEFVNAGVEDEARISHRRPYVFPNQCDILTNRAIHRRTLFFQKSQTAVALTIDQAACVASEYTPGSQPKSLKCNISLYHFLVPIFVAKVDSRFFFFFLPLLRAKKPWGGVVRGFSSVFW